MMFLDQSFTLFRMVDLVFLYVLSYMLKRQAECKHSFCEKLHPFSIDIYNIAKTVSPFEI